MLGPILIGAAFAIGVSITAFFVWRSFHSLRAARFVVATRYAPVDVQIMRIIDLTREQIQRNKRLDSLLPDELRQDVESAWEKARDATRPAAMLPGEWEAMKHLGDSLDQLEDHLNRLQSYVEFHLSERHLKDWGTETQLARARLGRCLIEYEEAVRIYNEQLDRPTVGMIGRILGFHEAQTLTTHLAIESEPVAS